MKHHENAPRKPSLMWTFVGSITLLLISCTDKVEGEGDGASTCTASFGASLAMGGITTQGTSRARSYKEQPQHIDWEIPEEGHQIMALSGLSSFVAVYDRDCALEASSLAFPQVKAQLVGEGLDFKAVEVEVDPSDAYLRSEVVKDICLKSLSPNRIVRTAGFKSMGFNPNDTLFGNQTHHTYLESEAAWDIFYAPSGISGSQEVVVAVVDTGINTAHEDLVNQLWDDGSGNHGYRYYPFGSDNYDVMDDNGHGTHVAGLIAAEIENGKGVAGMAPRHVKIMALKALGGSDGTGAVADVVNSVTWAAQNGADVINLSLGISGSVPTIRSAIENAIANGVFVVAAAGNSNWNLSQSTVSPANYASSLDGFMSVGSLDVVTGNKSGFSNYSSSLVEIFAPGSHGAVAGLGTVGLWSTVGVAGNGPYEDFKGTSMASPVVAGAAALMIAYYKDCGKTWTPAMIEAQIKEVSPKNCNLSSFVQEGRYLNLKKLAEKAAASVP